MTEGFFASFLTKISKAEGGEEVDDGEVRKHAEQHVSLQQRCPSSPLPPE